MSKYDYNNNSNLKIPRGEKLSSLDFNFGEITTGDDSNLQFCNQNTGKITLGCLWGIRNISHNAGTITAGNNTEIHTVDNNIGQLQIGMYSYIKSIKRNWGEITIGNHSEVTHIKYNSGVIILGQNCKVGKVQFNTGTITGGPNCSIPKDHGILLKNSEVNSGSGAFSAGNLQPAKNKSSTSKTFKTESKFRNTVGLPTNETTTSNLETMTATSSKQNKKMKLTVKDEIASRIAQLNLNHINSNTDQSVRLKSPDKVSRQTYAQGNASLGQMQTPLGRFACSPSVEQIGTTVKASSIVLSPQKCNLKDSNDRDKCPTPLETVESEKYICSICMENENNIAFGCGHLCCVKCAQNLIECHLCRTKIVTKIKLFF